MIPETNIRDLDWTTVPSPCYVVDRRLVEHNAKLHARVAKEADVTVLLALKGFAMWGVFDVLQPYLGGCCASGPIEAQLAREKFNKEVHTYSVAFTEDDVRESLKYSEHIIFNSPGQLQRFASIVRTHDREIDIGLRINPEYSEVEVELYNPCAVGSRLGTRRDQISDDIFDQIDGLHSHVMCEQGSDVFERVLAAIEAKFGDVLSKMKWINFGGGHHISKPGYDIDHLIMVLKAFKARHPHLRVFMEPGESHGLNTGVLVATVLDIVHNGLPIAILDVSGTAHMPDVLEMPYRPTIHGAGDPGATKHTYRLGGPTCLAGDVIGDWSFPAPLAIGQQVVFADMAHYTMVKTSMFNGVRHPSIATWDGQQLKVLRTFGYEDYANRLS